MRAHLVQMNIAWESRQQNFEIVRRLLGESEIEAGDLIILPELFDGGFSLNVSVTNDDGGETVAFLQTLARDTGCTVQGGRTVLAGGARALNMAPVMTPSGERACEYAKIHPFSFGREPEAFRGGDRVVTYPWRDLTVCPAICYDLRFPELFRIGLRAGADVFALGANWPAARQAHWRALAIARAIENQGYVLAVNRTGSDPHLPYAGGSIAVGPRGEVVGELGDEETVLSVAIDPSAVRAWRETFPAWRDIRLMPTN